jgi:hypothetical protein
MAVAVLQGVGNGLKFQRGQFADTLPGDRPGLFAGWAVGGEIRDWESGQSPYLHRSPAGLSGLGVRGSHYQA